jgi:hypothetical protein
VTNDEIQKLLAAQAHTIAYLETTTARMQEIVSTLQERLSDSSETMSKLRHLVWRIDWDRFLDGSGRKRVPLKPKKKSAKKTVAKR